MREDLTQKFSFLAEDEVLRLTLGQKKSAFNFNDIIKNKKIFLANLNREKWESRPVLFGRAFFEPN